MADLPLSFLAIASLAVVLVGIAKAGFGGGVGVVAVPLMLLAKPHAMTAAEVSAILLPILCCCDLVSVGFYRRLFEPRYIRLLAPGAVAGVLLGALMMGRVSSDALKLGIGVLSILFVLDQLLRPLLLRSVSQLRDSFATAALFSALTGFASMLAHAGGPPATIFLLPRIRDRALFVGTTVVFFTALNAFKLPFYYALDLFGAGNLLASALLAPFVPVGVLLGVWLNRTMEERVFRRVIHALLFLTGVKLIADGL